MWRDLKKLKIDANRNLWSYTVLKGAYTLSLKIKDAKEEKKYAETKKELLEEISLASEQSNLEPVKRHLQVIKEALLMNGYDVKVCKAKVLNRAVIGTSEFFGKIPFEISLFFDPILNVPFVPGSSLKGAFRQALEALLERREASKHKVDEMVELVFGSNEWSGLVGVTDAYPIKHGVNGFLFEPDVVTPHYPKAKNEFDVKPNPVPFLTIARDVVFKFYIYFNKEIYREEFERLKRLGLRTKRRQAELGVIRVDTFKKELSNAIIDNALSNALLSGDLDEAIRVLKSRGLDATSVIPWVDRSVLYAFAGGVGAKTSVGYSRFEVIEYRSVKG